MVAEQVYIFLETILVGAIMGVVFDFFRALRRNGNTRNIIVYIQDIIFWIIVAIIIITSSFILNAGELRGYMLIGYVLGAFLYLLALSFYVKGFFMIIMNLFDKVWSTITSPFRKIIEKFGKKRKNLEDRQEFWFFCWKVYVEVLCNILDTKVISFVSFNHR